jgi:thiosulfate/3-mercaptopyruvate sulfurtransferase
MNPNVGMIIVTLFAMFGVVRADVDPYPRSELLIEPSQLNKADVAKGFVVLDAREKVDYEKGHVSNARWVNHAAWAKAFGHGGEADCWGKRIGALGVGKDTKVIVYDDNSNKDAARIWWLLRYWGVEDVRLLNGGWTGWKSVASSIAKGDVVPVAVKFEAKARPDRLATKEQLLKSLKDGGIQIVDARSENEYCGVEKMTNKRAGAIPGAKHLEWIDLIDKNTKRFKSSSELKNLFFGAGIDLSIKTATHCQSGGRAAVMAFGLELMGAKDVSNYYPSWLEWGNADDTPIIIDKAKDKK